MPDEIIQAAPEAVYREETNQDISGDSRPAWDSLDLGQEPYRELAAAAVDAAMPLIREQIATELEASHKFRATRGSPIRLGALSDAVRIVRGRGDHDE